jgi:broad specificity phosphatase PhoE
MTTIYFIRHGQTESNIKKVWTGQTDVPLSKIGQQQCKDLVPFFNKIKIDVIYSSPFSRAKITATPLALNHELKIRIDKRLKERNFGELELKPTIDKDMFTMFDWQLNSDLQHGVERIQDMYFQRIKPFIEEILIKHKNETIVVVAHS